jgi:hypothetical protein
MIVTPFTPTPAYPERLQSQADADGLVRSPGLHLSTIYRDMAETISPREPIDAQDLAFYGAGGFLFERVFDMAHRDAVLSGDLIRPGEFERDGIIGSPDALDFANSRVVETKCRWMSARKFDALEKNFFFELLQIKCYLAMIGWTQAELSVFFVCGNWAPPVPCIRSVLLDFSEREIEEAWSSVRQHAIRKGWLK